MTSTASVLAPKLDNRQFQDPDYTLSGERRAAVSLKRLKTLWFNTGSLCNIACENCYIDTSPSNDRLAYLTAPEVRQYLNEIDRERLPVAEIGFTGGEPFMNPEFPAMLAESLAHGYRALVLTNAMKPLMNRRAALLVIKERYRERLTVRVSIDHFTRRRHEAIRGPGTWRPMMAGLEWLAENGFTLAVAGRTLWGEPEIVSRRGYAGLFAAHRIPVDASDPAALVLFPEMDAEATVPEITESCWSTLGVKAEAMMCATSRMVVKRKGASRPVVLPCTLLPYDTQFELGHDLAGAVTTVKLNHPHCAKFCVLGNGSCSPR